MKINLLFLLCPILMSLASCKKTYTCSCSTSYTYQNSSGGYSNIIIPASNASYSEKLPKKKAKTACQHEQNAIQTNFTNGITGNGQSSLVAGESIITSCAIITK